MDVEVVSVEEDAFAAHLSAADASVFGFVFVSHDEGGVYVSVLQR